MNRPAFINFRENRMNPGIRSIVSSATAWVVFATLLSGCASAPRTADADKAIRKVAVVSLLNENAPVVHLGLTVFNNDRTVIDQHGELNRLATNVIEQRLHAARPDWTIVPVPTDAALAKKSASGTPWVSFTGNIKEDLQRAARDADADLVFAIIDTTQENSPGRGVGIQTRSLSKSMPGSAVVHAHVLLVLVDRNGTELTRRGGSDGRVSASDLGLNYDLSSLQDTQVQQRVSTALREQLRVALTEAAQSMGY